MTIPTIALIGVSGYGKVHYDYLKVLAEAGKINFAAAVIRPSSMEKNKVVVDELQALGAKIYPSDDALLEAMKDSLDLICLPVGIEAHRPMTCKFLEAGINVLLEKPAAGCISDVQAMIDAEKKSGKFVAVGFHNMYGRDFHAIKREILSGRHGALKNISFKGAWARHDKYYSRNSWVGKCYMADGTAIFDSPANNAFAHYLNIALFCAGLDFETTAHAYSMQAELVKTRDIETFDTCGIRIVTANDIPIQVMMTHACEVNCEPYVRFDLENAQIHWDSGINKWFIVDSEGKTIHEEELPDWRKSMFDDMVARLSDPEVFTYTLANSMEHTFCIEKLHQLFMIKTLSPSEYDILADRDNQRAIHGILETFDTAFRKNLLPSETGAIWSPSAEVKYLDNINNQEQSA